MVLAQCNLNDLIVRETSLHAGVTKARVLVTQAETASPTDTTDVEIRDRVVCQDSTVQFRKNNVADRKGSAEYESGYFGDGSRAGATQSGLIQIFLVEPGQEVLRSVEYDTFGKLPVILIAKTQGKILVASEGEKFISVNTNPQVI